ncbi:HEPN domain-containing protein [Arcobacter cloacae]|uniref:Uncharacterized protein n=1 Tax=Arcobacter cloacae TaxID=1054034 RepID=A0A6M8N3L3_9BACT|nr:HEPN domain-containing protein [Arcobacter cloacae]QKF88743.1 hypothetical protein ACLO_0208 [Arcobacter cloacae]RXI41705.1 hypothetical protein CP963_06285 [Arcobacter cloacae]
MKKIGFQLNGTLVYGNLDLENKCIILDLNIYNSIVKELNDYFNEAYQFDIFGVFDDGRKISAFTCSVIEFNFLGKTKIHFLQLYVGNIHMKDSKNQKVKKVIFQISGVNNLPNINSLIIQENFSLTILNDKKTFQISVENTICLDEINKVIFELTTFFQIIILDVNIEFDKKIFYTQNNEEIELVLKSRKIENDKTINKLIDFDSINEKTLIKWFDTKKRFGKIFDYLSGIFNNNASTYIELNYFLLIQWIEAYCGVLYKSNINEKNIEKKKKKLMEVIDKSCLSEEDKQDFKDNAKYDKQGYIFSKKLELLFDGNETLKDLFNSDKTLLDDIKHYRNNLTHINIVDNLDNQEMHNLHEILKNIIYILIIEELTLPKSRFYDYFKKEAKRYFKLYKDMKE